MVESKDSSACWCGSTALQPFSPDYDRCGSCGTLVVKHMPGPEISMVRDDAADFYGREYWFSHQKKDLGFPDITERARADLPERALHWLAALLKYKLPPGRILELGSAHGGFVALLRWAGFDASGLELSPWIAQFASETFQIPVLAGPIEQQSIEPGSLDAIALMDVLEHLPDPVGTMRKCLEILKPDGILLIQTPGFRTDRTFEQMTASDDPFLMQFKPEQHLMLFSRESVMRLFSELGAPYIQFEPAIFSHYDMFLAVSRSPLEVMDPATRDAALTRNPAGRLILALLDLRKTDEEVKKKLESAEEDRQARLKSLEEQAARLGEMQGEIEIWKARCEAAERDRAARLEVIENQGARLGDLAGQLSALEFRYEAAEQDRAARLQVIESQGARLSDLEANYLAAEQDRAARLEVIEKQGARLGELEGERNRLHAELAACQAAYRDFQRSWRRFLPNRVLERVSQNRAAAAAAREAGTS